MIDVLSDIVVAYREEEFLRIRSGHRHHGELAFPRFAEPAALRELLNESGPFTFRIAPLECGPGVQPEDQDRRQQDRCDDELALAGELEIEFEIHGAESTSYVSVR